MIELVHSRYVHGILIIEDLFIAGAKLKETKNNSPIQGREQQQLQTKCSSEVSSPGPPSTWKDAGLLLSCSLQGGTSNNWGWVII
jgi:hypothetical protein